MDREIDEWVATCTPCQESRLAPQEAPDKEWERPQAPWFRVHIDFAGPVHSQTFFRVVDAYSKWLEVVLMTSTTVEAIIKVLWRLFSTHGLPNVLVSDNWPQFTAMPFETFLASQGIRHALVAPFHLASNGQAERMVRSAKEALTRMGPGDWQIQINHYLLIQHITPSSTTGRSPSELLMGCHLRKPTVTPAQASQSLTKQNSSTSMSNSNPRILEDLSDFDAGLKQAPSELTPEAPVVACEKFQQFPSGRAVEQTSPSDLSEGTTHTELRKSGRAMQKPTYLRDYVTSWFDLS
ncbi:PREDICTED: uncharacterized protein K02A2.6-like [Thamnophis sirtalis]|uniref:Uncharacterized protein K02A2.6-like n=1 Tax=Thamnophis sirtalis TaxID=35019 RepID=A0A6I9WWM4_9SAUR|nr:PREDICTED: uncharacterized protein K02A2.6-like [Thamnophis sirtalis]